MLIERATSNSIYINFKNITVKDKKNKKEQETAEQLKKTMVTLICRSEVGTLEKEVQLIEERLQKIVSQRNKLRYCLYMIVCKRNVIYKKFESPKRVDCLPSTHQPNDLTTELLGDS